MASIIKQAIKDVLAQLATAKNADGRPVFTEYTLPTSVAVYNDQFARDESGSGYSFEFPAAFVQIEPEKWALLGAGVSTSDLVWKIHIAHQELDAMDGTMDQNLNVFDIRDSIKEALTLFKPTNCSNFQPCGEQEDYRHDNVYHLVIAFKCSIIDTKGSYLDPDSGATVVKQPPTTLNIEGSIDAPYLNEIID